VYVVIAVSRSLLASLVVSLLVACRATDADRARGGPGVAGEGARAPQSPARASDDTDDTRAVDERTDTTDAGGHDEVVDDEHATCVAECIERHQMQATAPEVIAANCRRSCADER
jgi:hypothetical protein